MTTHRPELHFIPDVGILDAPAGVLRDGDTWHMFYQYRPTPDAPSRWGHEISEDDSFNWLECDDVIAPVGGETAVRAGSVAPAGEGVDLYFTSATAAGSPKRPRRVCSQPRQPLSAAALPERLSRKRREATKKY